MARTINSLAGIIKRLPDTTPRTGCIKHILFPFPAPRGRGHLPSNAIRDNAMNVRISALVAIAAFALAGLLGSGQSLAENAYITNLGSNTVSVIDTKTNKVTATIPVGAGPLGVAVSPDGSKVYISNDNDNPGTVAVIDAATNAVTATIPVGSGPQAFGVFIQPAPRVAGTPGKANCYGKSVSALARQYGGLNSAAAALGYSDVSALQTAIMAFCEG